MTEDLTPAPYTVLARKHRPQDFDALIGQDALVRVLSNAFERDRIAHAFMLTGVRGVGKTTTARIIAKGLNCLSSDGPTIKPCGTCANCVAIAESRHVDVIEMDAASRTGIDDIREIIESVRYRAAQARYKVYIIDEVHMLSKSAFNGLLKTLEEPPPHVKFVLATTDIHKVPATVLSRCMRFDLRRVDAERMIAHLSQICAQEGVEAEPSALGVIARVSEGSVRDALSLLDQAISHGAGAATETAVRDMLGLAERGRLFELFELTMKGEIGPALEAFRRLYVDGGDPLSILRETAEICHLASIVKVAPTRAEDPTLPPAERAAATRLAETLPVRALSRAWQMLLKGIEETARAPSALAAAEMVLIRMTHVAELPAPEELVRRLAEEGGGATAPLPTPATPPSNGGRAGPAAAPPRLVREPASSAAAAAGAPAAIRAEAPPAPQPRIEPPAPEPAAAVDGPADFDALIGLIREKRDAKLMIEVEAYVRPGPLRPGAFEFSPAPGAPPSLAATLGRRLGEWTGARWIVSVADGHDGPTIAERRAAVEDDLRAEASAHPLVMAALAAFPGAALERVTDLTAAPAPRDDAAFDEDALLDDDDDDPFGLDMEFAPYDDDDFNRDPL